MLDFGWKIRSEENYNRARAKTISSGLCSVGTGAWAPECKHSHMVHTCMKVR